MGSDMPSTCNFITHDGTPCANPVTGFASNCAAGHPVARTSNTYAPLSDSSVRDDMAQAPGVVLMEDVIYAPLPADADDAELNGAGF